MLTIPCLQNKVKCMCHKSSQTICSLSWVTFPASGLEFLPCQNSSTLSPAASAPQLFCDLLSLYPLLRIPPFSGCWFFHSFLMVQLNSTSSVKSSRIFPRRVNYSFFCLAFITVWPVSWLGAHNWLPSSLESHGLGLLLIHLWMRPA